MRPEKNDGAKFLEADPDLIRACLKSQAYLEKSKASWIAMYDTFLYMTIIMLALVGCGCLCMIFNFESCWRNVKISIYKMTPGGYLTSIDRQFMEYNDETKLGR